MDTKDTDNSAVNATMKTIRFRKGDENRVVIETNDYASSIFSEQYKQSVHIWERLCRSHKDFAILDNTTNAELRIDGVSNIIAFCGDRGEGKTSCMLSFAEMLQQISELKQMIPDYRSEDSTSYVLPLVDPLYFDENHHLLDHVIGQMYSTIEDCNRNKQFLLTLKDKVAERKELLMQFQCVQQSLQQLENVESEAYDELEALSNRAVAIRLRHEIANLFKQYLSYVDRKKLIIPIDDIDLNMTYGYQMVEDIRKYLCNPYCVLLLGVKIEQLVTVIQTRMVSDLKDIENAWERTLPMAQKYVTKLLPYENRVVMPTIADWAEWNIKCQFEENEKEQELPVKDYVVQLIFDRTRYLFYNEKGQVSPIVPHSLRGLRQLLGMLESMRPYVTNKGPEQNKVTFKDYFYHEWVSCLAKKDQLFVQQLVSHTDIISLNKFVVSHIAQKLSNDERDDLSMEIMRSANMAHNISVGDVFYVLGRFAHSISTEDQKNLVCFIYSFYSIKLYDLYDEITIDAEHLHPNMSNKEEEEKTSAINVYRSDAWYRHTNRLQQFVNGSMFTFNLGDLLPKEDGKLARDRRVLFMDDWESDLKLVQNHIAQKKDFTDDTRDAFLRCELLAMFTTRGVSGNNKFVLTLDRREIDPYYLTDYTRHTNYLEFNILAPFTNAINIRYAYHRFDQLISGFYELALQNDWSLLRKIMSKADVAKNGAKTTDDIGELEMMLASNSIIRVSEVLLSLMERLKNGREANNRSETTDVLQSVISTIKNSGIRLYHRGKEAGRSYEICFDFLGILYDALKADDTFISRIDKGMTVYQKEQEEQDKKSKGAKKNLSDTQILNKVKLKFGIQGILTKPIASSEVRAMLRRNNEGLYVAFGDEFWDKVYARDAHYSNYAAALRPMLTVDKKKVLSLVMA